LLKSAAPPVEYLFPETVEAACRLKADRGAEGFFIAGGTDLLLFLEQQQVRPRALIDVTRIPDLLQLRVQANRVTIGAGVTFSRMLASGPLCAAAPSLAHALRTIGGVQVRNVATLVGNVVNASPAADSMPPLHVLRADVGIVGPQGKRRVPVTDFVLGVRQTVLSPGELVTDIGFDLRGPGWHDAFEKLGLRQAMAIAVASVCLAVRIEDHTVQEARLALGAVGPTVFQVQEAADALLGTHLDDDSIEQASHLASAAARPIDDVRASAGYRRRAVAGLIRRALLKLRRQMESDLADA